MIGQNVGKYQIVDRLGKGGMGTVYRAVDQTLHREVAIKVLNAELNDPEVAKRFRAEAITVARLSHPGIAGIYELFEHEGEWLMVMEFVRGETLENMVNRMGPLSAQRAAELCMQTLTALAHAHSMGVVHRDLKPANLMVTENGSVKVMDFGIARVSGTEHLTNAGFMMGTPAYMAPEQVRGDAIDARADLYALGVVFYRLTTAKLPFKGDTAFAMVQSQVNDPPTPLGMVRSDLPPWTEDVVSRALAKAPEQRFQSAAEFHEAFARCLAGLPLSSMYLSASGDPLTPSRPMSTGAFQMRQMPTPGPMPSGQFRQPPTPSGGSAAAESFRGHATPATGSETTVLSASTPAHMISGANDQTMLTPGATSTTGPAGPAGPAGPTGPAGSAGPTAAGPATTGAGVPAGAGARAAGKGGSRKFWLTGLTMAAAAGLVIVMMLQNRQPGATSPALLSPTAPEGTPPAATPPEDAGAAGATGATGTTGAGQAPSGAALGAKPATGAATASTPGTAKPAAASSSAAKPAGPAGPVGPASNDALVTFPNVKLYAVTKGKSTSDRDALLNFAGGQLLVMPKTGGTAMATLPYRRITRATYVKARDPKWDPTLPAPPVGLDVGSFMRGGRHWLVLQGPDHYEILRLEDNNFSRILATFEERTGIKIDRPKGD